MRGALAAALLVLPLALPLGLGACSKDTDPGPGGTTVGEAKALDKAAERLEARPRPPLDEATVPADLAAIPGVAASDQP
ncbi:hypothetical protein [Novosphingobium olei]|uniref:Uncharacterized protein n=1 Tax=Novosphingobium olei TaxID=2728851 RepID=A0A7Y0BSZ4_9SPHN|nr:hypothetical protein [Novosphingobium olei]NML96057.1 hypothetical protein [Novosphingobium olei]